MSRCANSGLPAAVLAVGVGMSCLTLPNPVEAAGGTFAVDDSDVAKPGDCKVESWASFASNSDLGVTSPACVANLGVPVEVGLALARFRADDVWGSELVLKGQGEPPSGRGRQDRCRVGLSGAVAFDLLKGEHSASAVNVLTTFQIIEQFKINVNAGYLYAAAEDLDWVTYGAGFEWNFVKPLTLIGEVFGLAGQKVEPSSRTDPRAQVGLRYTPIERLDIDLIYGRNVFGENAHWVTVGLNLRFEAK
jgi:hypothetical protein